MKFTRLAVEAKGRTLEVKFHPNLTVITGVGSTTRESMINELLSGLCTHRSGTHIEIVTDGGRRLVIFRPTDAPHRVIDASTGADVSAEFTSSSSTIDLLETFGMDAAATRRWSRIGPNDLVASTGNQELVGRLGRIDQSQLWSAAQRVQIARQTLENYDDGAETDDAPEDRGLTERIDHTYESLDVAKVQADQTRLPAAVVGTVGLLGAAIAVSINQLAALILVLIAIVGTIVMFVFRARVTYYTRQLDSALAQSGSESYLGYQLDRIDGYVSSEQKRRHRAAVKADVDDALARWKQAAGDVSVDWALEHRPAIEAAAGLNRGVVAPITGDGALVPRHARDEAPELIETLVERITKNRRLGSTGESFPLLLDEPFGTFDPSVRPALLETLVAQAGQPQIVLLTNSEDIVSWARLEELTGALSLVGPGQNPGPKPEDVTSTQRRMPPTS